MQVIQRPDDAGRALVETGVAVFLPFATRMPRPEPVGIEAGDGIGRNFFDRRPNGRFIPGVICKRTMTAGDDHAGGSPGAIRLRQMKKARIARFNATYLKA